MLRGTGQEQQRGAAKALAGSSQQPAAAGQHTVIGRLTGMLEAHSRPSRTARSSSTLPVHGSSAQVMSCPAPTAPAPAPSLEVVGHSAKVARQRLNWFQPAVGLHVVLRDGASGQAKPAEGPRQAPGPQLDMLERLPQNLLILAKRKPD